VKPGLASTSPKQFFCKHIQWCKEFTGNNIFGTIEDVYKNLVPPAG
jgi:hypothetical protein